MELKRQLTKQSPSKHHLVDDFVGGAIQNNFFGKEKQVVSYKGKDGKEVPLFLI